MKETYGYGPMSVNPGLPKTPSGEAEGEHGTIMNPGPETHKFTGRTSSKFKSWKHEAPPKTPMGSGGGAMKP